MEMVAAFEGKMGIAWIQTITLFYFTLLSDLKKSIY